MPLDSSWCPTFPVTDALQAGRFLPRFKASVFTGLLDVLDITPRNGVGRPIVL